MSRLLVGELIKVRTTRTAFGFALAALLLTILTVIVSILAGDPASVVDKRGALNFGGVLAIVLLLYGAVGATGEFRHRTLAPAVLIAPDRMRLVIARIAAYGLTAALVGVAIGVVALGIGVPLLGGTEGPDLVTGDYLSVATGGLLAGALCAALGVGIGTLLRNQVGAVVGVLLWLFIAEPLVGVANDDWIKYTIGISSGALGAGGNEDASMLTAALVLTTWALALSIAGILVDRRRDVD